MDVIRVMSLKRFGVSIPEDLLKRFDEVVFKRGYVGRSEAIRDAMRLFLSQYEADLGEEGNIGTISVVYKHKPRVMANLTKMQHGSDAHVISTMHVHLTPSHCLEVATVKGKKEGIQNLANKMGGLTGVEYVRLFSFGVPDLEHEH
jgi:CopG family nickel-responsive transcriptional regulator